MMTIEPEILRGQKDVVVSSVKKGLKPLVLEKSNLSTASKVSNAGAAASQSRLKASSSFNMSPTSEALPESTTDFPSKDSFSPSEELADTSLESSFQEQTESKENSKPNLNSRKRPTGTTILGKHLVAEKERRDEDREIRRQEMEQRKEERKDEKKRRLDEIERQQAVRQQQHAEKMEVERSKVKFIAPNICTHKKYGGTETQTVKIVTLVTSSNDGLHTGQLGFQLQKEPNTSFSHSSDLLPNFSFRLGKVFYY